MFDLEPYFDIALSIPNGVKKLREMILTLAMQGRLVPQDPNDVPASELLKEIEAEKQRLVKAGKIKKQKPLAPISKDEIPYDIPDSWQWVRLGNVAEYNGRKNVSSDNVSSDTWVLDLEDIEKDTSRLLAKTQFQNRPFASSKSLFCKGDILYGKLRPYLDKVIVADEDGVCTTEIVPILPHIGIDSFFLRWSLKRPDFISFVNRLMYGVKMPRLGTTDAITSIHPLPPFAEQKHIVAKIEQLMARCDALETLKAERDKTLQGMHSAAISQLLNSETSDAAWSFLKANFSTLCSTRENISELRKAILQLAVMGKLVPQDPNDEPASELLKEIEAEKQRLIKAGKIKKQKIKSILLNTASTHTLPLGWSYCLLEDLFAVITDGDHQPPPKSSSGIPFMVIGNFNIKDNKSSTQRYVPIEYYNSLDWTKKPQKDDLLYSVTGSFGIPILIESNSDFCVQRHIAILKSMASTPVKYIKYLLHSTFALQYVINIATGIAQKTVPLSGLRSMPILLPPQNEQKRIVAKVDSLMKICDELDFRLEDKQGVSEMLMDDMIKEATFVSKFTPKMLQSAQPILDKAFDALIRTRGEYNVSLIEQDLRTVWNTGYQKLKWIFRDMAKRDDKYKYIAIRYMETSNSSVGVASEFQQPLAKAYGIKMFSNTSMQEDRRRFWATFTHYYCD